MNYQITSRLHSSHRDELEKMFYFHPQQSRFSDQILASVEQFGSPQISVSPDGLKFRLPKLPDSQTLYVVTEGTNAELLVGAMVFHRPDARTLEILHIAVHSDLTYSTNEGNSPIVMLLVKEICRIGRRVKGIESIRLMYGRGQIQLRDSTTFDFSS
jgi:hypothetical protein